MDTTKICTKCQTEKLIGEFAKHRRGALGVKSHCKSCCRLYLEKWRAQNKDKLKMYQSEYDAKRAGRKQIYYQNNKEHITERNKEWANCNKDKKRLHQAKSRKKHRHKANATRRSYQILRKKTDVNYKLAINLRNRLLQAIKIGAKSGSAVRDLGCSISFLKKRLEKQFLPGMAWENYGRGLGRWHIDHIVPLSKFDLTDRAQCLNACHYSNLAPIWALDNILKSNKLPHELNHSECDDDVSRGAIDAA